MADPPGSIILSGRRAGLNPEGRVNSGMHRRQRRAADTTLGDLCARPDVMTPRQMAIELSPDGRRYAVYEMTTARLWICLLRR